MSPFIRKAALSDVEKIAELHSLCFAEAWDGPAFHRLLQNANAFALIGGTASESQSFIVVQVAAGESEILSLGTNPASRRKGYARSLVLAASEEAARLGAREMFLEVAADNEAALALYARLGFSPAGRRVKYYGRPDSPAVDAMILRTGLPL